MTTGKMTTGKMTTGRMTIKDMDTKNMTVGDVMTDEVMNGDVEMTKDEFLAQFSQLNSHIEKALAAQDFDRAMRIDSARRNMLHEFAAATVPDGDKVFFETLEKCAADNARAITKMISEIGAMQRRAGHQMRSLSRYCSQQG
jgi:nucleoside-triphosphatase THEP1